MKKGKKMINVFRVAMIAGFVVAGAGNVAGSDMESMMAEGIAYDSPAVEQKVIISKEGVRATMGRAMTEGIAYPDSVLAEDALVAKIDHRLATLEDMENCLCEDGTASVESMIAAREEKALKVMPAAGK